MRTFAAGANTVVIGATGGIGAALCRALSTDPVVATVHALSRRAGTDATGKLRYFPLDLDDEDSIERAAARCAATGDLHLVIVASGVLHRGALQPEKKLRDLDPGHMLETLRVNTVGPAVVARHFLPLMARRGKSVFAALSARVGSIADNRLGGWLSYRTSKAALNMVLKTVAIEHARQRPESIVVALHPGTVDTALSRPFSKRVPDGKLFNADDAAHRLLVVIDGLVPAQSGEFLAWDGQAIPY